MKHKQLIVVGDFFQLSPVTTKADLKILKEFYQDYDKGYAFESPYWNDLNFKMIILKQVVRQNNESFITQLNKAWVGDCFCIAYFNNNARKERKRWYYFFVLSINWPKRLMIEELFALKSPSKVYKSHIEGEVNELDKPTFNRIELKAGARVIVLVNDVDENQYHNGSLATVTDLNDESVKVALNNGDVGEIGVYV